MTRVTKRPAVADTYFRLVRRFPLTHLRSDAHLDEALSVVDGLLERERDAGEDEYLDVLTDLVEQYEAKHVSFDIATEAELLRELMRANGLSQSRLATETGIAQSTLSAILSGSRSLTKPHVAILAKRFRVSPALFFPSPD